MASAISSRWTSGAGAGTSAVGDAVLERSPFADVETAIIPFRDTNMVRMILSTPRPYPPTAVSSGKRCTGLALTVWFAGPNLSLPYGYLVVVTHHT